MPRDLESEHQTIQGLAPLSRADEDPPESLVGYPDAASPPIIQSPEHMTPRDDMQVSIHKDGRRDDKKNALHPVTSALTINDVDGCVIVENSCFPPHERCARETFRYRLTTCGEVCFGIYTSAYLDPPNVPAEEDDEYEPQPQQYTPSPPLPSKELLEKCPTVSASHDTDAGDGRPRKVMLLGHIVATRSNNPTIKDNDMEVPDYWYATKSEKSMAAIANGETPTVSNDSNAPTPKGHQSFGQTLCLHSLCILPEYKNLGLGRTLLQAYIERMSSTGGMKRIALLAHDELVPYYERFGFTNEGKSEATFGGGGWNDMVYRFPKPEEPPIQSFVGEE